MAPDDRQAVRPSDRIRSRQSIIVAKMLTILAKLIIITVPLMPEIMIILITMTITMKILVIITIIIIIIIIVRMTILTIIPTIIKSAVTKKIEVCFRGNRH